MENGQIYYDRNDIDCVIAQQLGEGVWVLLCGPFLAQHGGTCMTIAPGPDGKLFYTKAELQDRLEKEGWRYTKARLIIQVATVRDGAVVYDEVVEQECLSHSPHATPYYSGASR